MRYRRIATSGIVLGGGLLIATGPAAAPEAITSTVVLPIARSGPAAASPAKVAHERSSVPARFVARVRITLPDAIAVEPAPVAEPALAEVAEPAETPAPSIALVE